MGSNPVESYKIPYEPLIINLPFSNGKLSCPSQQFYPHRRDIAGIDDQTQSQRRSYCAGMEVGMLKDFEHHFQASVGDYIPNIWVMFN